MDSVDEFIPGKVFNYCYTKIFCNVKMFFDISMLIIVEEWIYFISKYVDNLAFARVEYNYIYFQTI